MGQGQRVAEGDEVGGTLGPHDAGDPGDAQDIPLAMATGQDQVQGSRLHANPARGKGMTAADGLAPHVHHLGLATGGEVGQRRICLCHRGAWARRSRALSSSWVSQAREARSTRNQVAGA